MDIKTFLKLVGVSGDLAKYLIDPEDKDLPEGFDAAAAVEEYTKSQQSVWMEKLKPEVEKQVGEKHDRTRRTLAKSLVDAFDLDISKTEAFEKGFDEVLKLGQSAVEQRLKDASKGTDEQLQTDLKTWKQRAKSFQDELSDAKETHKTELEAAKKEAETKIHNFQLKEVFRDHFDKLEYGVNKGVVKLFEDSAIKRIVDNYNVDLEGNMFSKEGNELPVAFDGKTTFKNLKEPIEYLAQEFGVLKKSNIPTDKNGNPIPEKTGEKTANVLAMEKRFEEKRKQAT